MHLQLRSARNKGEYLFRIKMHVVIKWKVWMSKKIIKYQIKVEKLL